jgi:hypothetical protein
MLIQEGHCYVMSNGNITGIIRRSENSSDDCSWYWTDGHYVWYKSGTYFREEAHAFDLVCEYKAFNKTRRLQ